MPLQNGWRVGDNVSSVTATVDPTGLPSLAMRFPAGYIGGASPGTVYSTTTFSVTRVRWEQVIAYPVGYVKHQSSVDKSVFVGVDERNKMYTMMYDPTRLIPAVGLQEIRGFGAIIGGADTISVNLTPNLGVPAELQRGQRYTLACEATGNTAGQRNGIVECWLDGTKILRYTAVQFSAGAARFTHAHWAPIWGGGGGTLQAPQSVYLARLRVWGK